MANNKIQLASPLGVARYPYLNEPDLQFAQKYGAAPEYKTQLIIEASKALPFKEKLENLFEEEYSKACKDAGKKLKRADLPFEEVVDPETLEPTGEWAFKFKLKQEGKNFTTGQTWVNKFPWLNAKRKPIAKPTEIVGGGSTLSIGTDVVTWNAPIGFGMTLRINSVQIVELKPYIAGGVDASLFEEHDGFEGEDSDNPAELEVKGGYEGTTSGSDF
jgi:hypothetical protein